MGENRFKTGRFEQFSMTVFLCLEYYLSYSISVYE
jgi:hypothetical protein